MAQHIIITNADDNQLSHVPFVRPHMGNEELIVIDPVCATIDDRPLTYATTKKGPAYFYNGRPLDNVASVWDRRPTALQTSMLDGVHSNYRDYSKDAVRMHALQVYGWFQDSLWVSDHYAVKKAELKSYQLTLATQLGFNVPETVFTSDPKIAQDFVTSQEATIVKPIGYESPTFDDSLLLFFSSRVTPDKKLDYSNLRYGPAIFQQAIKPRYDIRVTVIGETVFATAIIAKIEDSLSVGVRDWRIGNHAGDMAIHDYDKELPASIKKQCVMLVKKLGLQFGAIDLIRDESGKIWFIEINPAGQWAFVEAATKQPIGKAMARLLLSGGT